MATPFACPSLSRLANVNGRTDCFEEIQRKIHFGQLFFSTSFNRDLAVAYLGSHDVHQSVHGILFEIDADPTKANVKPFADLLSLSYFSEDEFLMAIGSIFYIQKVYLGENQIWFIEMTLCGNHDGDSQDMLSPMDQ